MRDPTWGGGAHGVKLRGKEIRRSLRWAFSEAKELELA